MMGNGLNSLSAIDPACAQKVLSCGLPDGPVVTFDTQGQELRRVASAASAYVHAKVTSVLWYQVQQSLLDFLPPDTLELGRALENADVTSDGVVLGFRGMPDVHTKVAIGCDGNQSVLRQSILGDGAPEFASTAVWRGQTPIPASWPHLDTHSTWFLDKPNATGVQAVRLTDGYIAWTVIGGWDLERAAELGSGRYIDATSTSPAVGSKLDRCLAKIGTVWPSHVLVRCRGRTIGLLVNSAGAAVACQAARKSCH
jgi:2-polyprenyl-6-methoxyphenol hydroxylase-like FAD-dependent oxidoreductase